MGDYPDIGGGGMSNIQIEREGDGYEVTVTDPEIEKANNKSKSRWKDPCVEYHFDTWNQVKTFLDKVVDKALPADEYSRAFATAAKESMGGK